MQKNKWILDEMIHARKRGIRVDVNGVRYDKKTAARLSSMIMEKGSYMLDYEGDVSGHIVALHVDPVGPSEKPSYKSLRCQKKRPEEQTQREIPKNEKTI